MTIFWESFYKTNKNEALLKIEHNYIQVSEMYLEI